MDEEPPALSNAPGAFPEFQATRIYWCNTHQQKDFRFCDVTWQTRWRDVKSGCIWTPTAARCCRKRSCPKPEKQNQGGVLAAKQGDKILRCFGGVGRCSAKTRGSQRRKTRSDCTLSSWMWRKSISICTLKQRVRSDILRNTQQ